MITVTDYTALISDYSLNGSLTNAPIFVSYSFLTTAELPSLADYQPFANNGYSAFTAAQQASFRDAISEIEKISGVKFVEVDDPQYATIQVMNASGSSFGGWATIGTATETYSFNGYLVIVTDGTSYQRGTNRFETILHEVGHSLSLEHPFEGDRVLPAHLDNENNTMMSYTSNGRNDTAPAPFDIQALQYLYGAPSAFTAGTVWNWSDVTEVFTLTGTGQADKLLAIDADAVVRGLDGSDILWGRDGNDSLDGGTDSDQIYSGGGDDSVEGGSGDDEIWALAGQNTIRGGAGDDIIHVGGASSKVVFDLALDPSNYDLVRNTSRNGYTITALNGNEGADTVDGYSDFSFAGADRTYSQLYGLARADNDDYAGSVFSNGTVQPGTTINGQVESRFDTDWFALNVQAGRTYGLSAAYASADPLTNATISLSVRDAAGDFVSSNYIYGDGDFTALVFNPTESGKVFLSMYASELGSYNVQVTDHGANPSGPSVDMPATVEAYAQKSITLGDVLSVTDAQNDQGVLYQVFDSVGDSNIRINGTPPAGTVATVRDLSAITLIGDDAPSSQFLNVRVFDGSEWSNFESFQLITKDGPAANDLTGNSYSDILWYNTATRQIGFYDLENNGYSWQSLGFAGSGYKVEGSGDFDGDGTSDILWLNAGTRQLGYYDMNGGAFSWQALGLAGSAYEVAGIGDFNGDGTDDILWYNTSTRQLGYYRMDGANFGWQSLGFAGSDYSVEGIGDFNDDGKGDILWFNTATRQIGYYEMNDTAFSWQSLGFAGTGYAVAGTGDYTGDGTDDILWFNTNTRQVGYYEMNAGSFAWRSLGIAGTGYAVAGTGDFSDDGTEDVLWYNMNTRQLGYYDLDGGNYAWESLGFAGANYEVAGMDGLAFA